MEITREIHLVPAFRGANAYLVMSDEGVTVVDTGFPGSVGRILDYVEKLGCDRSDVKMIILTHPDVDHAGSAARLREETQAKVAIHEADAPGLSKEEALKAPKHSRNRLLLRALGVLMRFERLNADVLLRDSDIIDGLTVVHTPGHTEGSICLYLPGRALFVGDALLTNHERRLSLPGRSMSWNLDLAKESVRKISRLDYSILLPGHGPPIQQNASAITREFVARF